WLLSQPLSESIYKRARRLHVPQFRGDCYLLYTAGRQGLEHEPRDHRPAGAPRRRWDYAGSHRRNGEPSEAGTTGGSTDRRHVSPTARWRAEPAVVKEGSGRFQRQPHIRRPEPLDSCSGRPIRLQPSTPQRLGSYNHAQTTFARATPRLDDAG